MLFLYIYYDIKTLVSCAHIVYIHHSKKLQIEKLLQSVNDILQKPHLHGDQNITDNEIRDIMYYNKIQYLYTTSSYEKLKEEIIREIEMREKYKGPIDALDILYNDIEAIVFQLKKEEDDKIFPTMYDKNKYNFISALKVFSENDWKIWLEKYQSSFSTMSMRYLYIKYNECNNNSECNKSNQSEENIKKCDNIENNIAYDFLVTNNYIKLSQSQYDELIESVGLLCASDLYCNLKITKVPHFVDWYIREYDGSESIVYR